MKLSENQIIRLTDHILNNLSSDSLIRMKDERSRISSIVRDVIDKNQKEERKLEKDAETLLDQTLRATGSSGGSIDRVRMLKMIKDKLAKERRFVL